MKRQTLLQIVIFAGLFLVFLGVITATRFQAQRAANPADQQEIPFGDFSLRLPKVFGLGRAYRDQAWEVREFRGGGLGSIRLGTEPGDGTPWEVLCQQWFGLPAYPAAPFRFERDGYDWFFKDVPVFGRGAYVLRKRGKQTRFILFFEHEGTRHWIGYDAANVLVPQKELFDGILLSLRSSDGSVPSPALRDSLRPIAREGGYRFVQPVEIILLVPAVMVVLISLIQVLVRWRAGRLPEDWNLRPLLFAEGGMELGMARAFQRKFLDCAVTVTQEDLVVHTFGTPFLSVPRAGLGGRIDLGKAWLGLPFVKLELGDPPVYLKWSRLYRGMKGPLTLRLYTRESEQLRALLLRS